MTSEKIDTMGKEWRTVNYEENCTIRPSENREWLDLIPLILACIFWVD